MKQIHASFITIKKYIKNKKSFFFFLYNSATQKNEVKIRKSLIFKKVTDYTHVRLYICRDRMYYIYIYCKLKTFSMH